MTEFTYNNPKLKIRRKELRNDMPKPEQILWYYLKGKGLKGYKFRRQHSIGYYILDFYCPKLRLAIELDGDSHFEPQAIVYDQERTSFLAGHNIRVIRFTNKEITDNIEGVIEKILELLP